MWKQAIEKKHKQEQEEKEAKEAEKKAREEAEKKAQEEAEKEKQEGNESKNGQKIPLQILKFRRNILIKINITIKIINDYIN